MNRVLALFITLFGCCGVAVTAADVSPRVSLLTCGPGREAYQLEGHTALRLKYSDAQDYVVNWGVFDFNSPGFAFRFVKGETDYRAALEPFPIFCYEYRTEGRSVTEQVLDLTEEQTECLVDLINDNLRPENCVYRYNYVYDNCATRPLNLIKRAVALSGDTLQFDAPRADTTFRKEMRRYHKDYPFYQFFIDFALGDGIDRPLTADQRAFAPLYLQDYIASARIVAGGESYPLVASESIIISGNAASPHEGLGSPLLYSFLLLSSVTCITVWAWRKKRMLKGFYVGFYAFWGILGCVLAFLMFVSVHEATCPNLNILWVNPLALTVPLLIWSRRTRTAVSWYFRINIVACAVYLLLIPFSAQSPNTAFFPLIAANILLSSAYLKINKK